MTHLVGGVLCFPDSKLNLKAEILFFSILEGYNGEAQLSY